MKKDIKHSLCLVAVFLIGNMIISFPKGEGQKGSLWGFFICLGLSFALCIFYSRLQSVKDFGLCAFSHTSSNKALASISGMLFILLCLLSYVVCCKEYIFLVDTLRLPNTSRFVIAPIFIGLTLLISLGKQKLFDSFSLVSFSVVALCSILMFVLSVSQSKPSLLSGNFPMDIKDSVIQALTYFIHSFGQILIVLMFIGKKNRAEAKKLQLLGIGMGSVVFLLCLSQVLLLLGPYVTELLDFPYAAATGSVTAAKSYSRLDGFTYYIYFICSLLKASVILGASIRASKAVHPLLSKITAAVFLICAFVFSTVRPLYSVLTGDAFNFILLCLEIITPIVLFIFLKLKDSSRRVQFHHTA